MDEYRSRLASILTLLAIVSSALCLASEPLKLWTINPGTPFGALTDTLAQIHSESNPERIESIHFANNLYKLHFPDAVGTSSGPDIFHSWGGSSLIPYIEKGLVHPLDGLKPRLREIFLDIAFEPVTYEGIIYGVPYSGLAGVFFWYRKDIFRRYGIEVPKTWEEFLRAGQTLKENNIVPLALANKNKWPGSLYYMYLVDRLGGPRLFSDTIDGKDGKTFLEKPFIDAGIYLQDLVGRGFFSEGFNRTEDEPGNWNSMFISGKAGMYLMGTWFLSVVKELSPDIASQIDFFPFPYMAESSDYGTSLIGSPGQDYLSISSRCTQKAAAESFLLEAVSGRRYILELASQGFVPPVKNTDGIGLDQLSLKIADTYKRAKNVQLYYDVILSQKHAEVHKLLVHQLMEMKITPEHAARMHEQILGGGGRKDQGK